MPVAIGFLAGVIVNTVSIGAFCVGICLGENYAEKKLRDQENKSDNTELEDSSEKGEP